MAQENKPAVPHFILDGGRPANTAPVLSALCAVVA